MIEHQYLIALALIEQGGKRALPLNGKSLKVPLPQNTSPNEESSSIVQQLLLRVFQRSEDDPIKRAFGQNSLLLIQIPIDSMQQHLPRLKSEWINTGNSTKLISELQTICQGVWKVIFTKQEGIEVSKLN